MSLWTELKRRNVFRVLAAYLVSSWLLIEIGTLLFESFEFPQWAGQLLITILALGLIPVVIFSWAYELTPEGVKRESEVRRDTSITHHTGRRLDQITIAMILMALGVIVVERFVLPEPGSPQQATAEPSEPAAMPEPAAASESERAEPPPNSLAVLAFENMSADPENEFFADGISEEILNVLARVEGLKVASRTSSFAFKGKGATASEIANTLNVAHVLEGSVRKQGDRVRVTAQLIEAETGFHVWSDNFDRRLDDIFAIQDEIARSILDALVAQLTDQPLPKTAETLTENAEAYELFLRGRHFWRMRNATALRQAVELLNRAVEIDPSFDRAWSGIAIVWANLKQYDPDTDPRLALERSREAAERALALNPSNGEALVAKADLLAQECRYVEADALYRRAIAADEKDPTVHHWYSILLKEVGRLKAAKQEIDQARELDSLNAAILSNASESAEFEGDVDLALQHARTAADLGFRDGSGIFEGLILARAARLEEAEPLLREQTAALSETSYAGRLDPGWVDAYLATLRNPDALPQLESVLADTKADWIIPDLLAFVGSTRTLDFIRDCHTTIPTSLWHPNAVKLRSTPEFFKAMEDAGIAEYWREVQWPDLCHELDPEQAECPDRAVETP